MNILIDYWYIIIAAIAVIVVAAVSIYKYLKLPTEDQLRAFKEWLLYAVVICEKELGEKTGRLKLRMCYDMAVTKFPWITKVLTFDEFAELVDEALEKMRDLLDSNSYVQNYVEGE